MRCTFPEAPRPAPSPDIDVQTIDPSKAPFAKSECHFDPLNFLGPFSAATFLEPRLLARDGPGASPLAQAAGPPARPAPPRPARQAGKPSDLLQYLKQWDDMGRLELSAATDSDPALRGTFFFPCSKTRTRRGSSSTGPPEMRRSCRWAVSPS